MPDRARLCSPKPLSGPAAAAAAAFRRFASAGVLKWVLACLLVYGILPAGAPPVTYAAQAARAAVAAEHPRAAEIGVAVLAAGGNAVDAAVATAFAVCVLNPSSCGVGGGGFMLVYQASTDRAYALDFREVAPSRMRAELLLRDGKLDPERLRRGGLAAGVPGFVAGLLAAQERFGNLTRGQVMAPAIDLAQAGFAVGPHLAGQIVAQRKSLRRSEDLSGLLLDEGGDPREAAARVTWPALAKTLRAVASGGSAAFYRGETARAIAAAVRGAGGVMSTADLGRYRPIWREPLAGSYRGRRVFTMPPPGSGGVLLEMLNALEGYEIAALGSDSPTYFHLLAEVMRVGFQDRAEWYGDPDYTEIPLRRLLSRGRAERIRQSVSHIEAGEPARSPPGREGGTSHLSVIDKRGNAAAATVTINTAFGAGFTAPGTGIILNNEMDDFSLPGGTPNSYGLVGSEPNRISAGKRPLSSMSPTILVADGRATLAIGASGGPKIISAILQVLLGIVDFELDSASAVALPRIHHQGTPGILFFERGVGPLARLALRRMGHRIELQQHAGAVQVVARSVDRLDAAADPRKQGGVAYCYPGQ